jgi:hypothetical protein
LSTDGKTVESRSAPLRGGAAWVTQGQFLREATTSNRISKLF